MARHLNLCLIRSEESISASWIGTVSTGVVASPSTTPEGKGCLDIISMRRNQTEVDRWTTSRNRRVTDGHLHQETFLAVEQARPSLQVGDSGFERAIADIVLSRGEDITTLDELRSSIPTLVRETNDVLLGIDASGREKSGRDRGGNESEGHGGREEGGRKEGEEEQGLIAPLADGDEGEGREWVPPCTLR